MDDKRDISQLGSMLKARRRSKGMSLRDLSDEIGVSPISLSRVERGHVPDLRNFQSIIDWLEVPAEMFLGEPATTPQAIARHLKSDESLSEEAATKIASIVEDMYRSLAKARPALAVHMRSAKSFTPAAGELLSEILSDFQLALTDRSSNASRVQGRGRKNR